MGDKIRTIYVPADRLWLDPRAVGYLTYSQQRTLTVSGMADQPAAPASAIRMAIGFVLGAPSGPVVTVSPFPTGAVGLGVTIPYGGILWFKLFDYYSLVGNAWYMSGSGPVPVVVIEVNRSSMV